MKVTRFIFTTLLFSAIAFLALLALWFRLVANDLLAAYACLAAAHVPLCGLVLINLIPRKP